ncbi:hypothetical protein NDU88_006745 [Pleurodeles waltl]|uniref:Uncharacterized protein n=1 Tax=Pleurodeles waltl TaxID=8319 RepID=A0AAV7RSR5_PLEWA|nr:hypothetical protein NDU88_006745 [Pleurodeles waltl]
MWRFVVPHVLRKLRVVVNRQREGDFSTTHPARRRHHEDSAHKRAMFRQALPKRLTRFGRAAGLPPAHQVEGAWVAGRKGKSPERGSLTPSASRGLSSNNLCSGQEEYVMSTGLPHH